MRVDDLHHVRSNPILVKNVDQVEKRLTQSNVDMIDGEMQLVEKRALGSGEQLMVLSVVQIEDLGRRGQNAGLGPVHEEIEIDQRRFDARAFGEKTVLENVE